MSGYIPYLLPGVPGLIFWRARAGPGEPWAEHKRWMAES